MSKLSLSGDVENRPREGSVIDAGNIAIWLSEVRRAITDDADRLGKINSGHPVLAKVSFEGNSRAFYEVWSNGV